MPAPIQKDHDPEQNQERGWTEKLADGTVRHIVPYGGQITLAEDREPWDRQPDEPDRSWLYYKYFQYLPDYRDIQ